MVIKDIILNNVKRYGVLSELTNEEDIIFLCENLKSKVIKDDEFVYIDKKTENLISILSNKKDWFQNTFKLITNDIEFAFYTGQYPINKINYFFDNIFNDEIFTNNTKNKDDLYDLYYKVINELNFIT